MFLTKNRRSVGNLCGPLANFKKSSFVQLNNLFCGWHGKSLYSKGSSDSKRGKLALFITLSARTSLREALNGWTCKFVETLWICVTKLISDISILSCFCFQTLFTLFSFHTQSQITKAEPFLVSAVNREQPAR